MSTLFVGVDLIHRLCIAVRFSDMFTGETVDTPMSVTIPSLRLAAFRADTDFTYRFVVTNRDIPVAAAADLQVEIPGGEYRAVEEMQVSFPISVGHPPPIIRPDYLAEFPLWPTRRRRPLAGETAVIGRITSGGATNVAALRVRLFVPPGPPPVRPYTYTDSNGEFFFRLPQLKARMSGSTPILTATLGVEIRDALNAIVSPVNPGSIVVNLGSSTLFEFTVP